FVTEQSGFRHLHLLDLSTEKFTPLTSGKFEVYPLALARDRGAVYVAATKEHPACRDLYRVNLADGSMKRLTGARGVYGDVHFRGTGILNVAVSPDGRAVLANYARFGNPTDLVRVETATGQQVYLTNSHGPAARKLVEVQPEFFSYVNRHGDVIHGYLFKPHGWSKADKRPLLIYTYGGPLGITKYVTEGSHTEEHRFAHYLAAKHGYVTCVIDPRGSSGYGSKFERANFGQPGQPQVEDLVDGVKYLVAHGGVDPKRVGVHGWRFGGFLTQLCLYTAPDVFAVGIAGAGPTEWENFNAWYTTGTIGNDGEKMKQFSLLPLAKHLKGKLLL